MATTFTGSRETATSTSTILNRVIKALPLPYPQARDYSTFLQVMGSESSPLPSLGTTSSVGTFSRSSIPVGYSLSPNSRGKVSSSALYSYLNQELSNSKLAGFVPADGRKYGIDGTSTSYANFMTQLAGFESGFRTTTVGDVGRYAGGSNGLFQLSPNDALTYKIQSTPFTLQQLRDPYINAKVAVKIMEANILRDGVIAGKSGPSDYLGASRYWGPLRPDRVNQLYVTPGKYSGVSLAARNITNDKVQNMAELAWDYNRTAFTSDPISSKIDFFSSLDDRILLYNLDNRPVFDYFKAYNSELDIIKQSLYPDLENKDSFLLPPSDSMGFWATNVFPKYTDNVAPQYDFNSFESITGNYALTFRNSDWTTEYGGPFTIPGSTLQKIPDEVFTLSTDMSDITKSIENYNTQSLLKPNDETDMFGADQTQPTQTVLTTDLPSYLDFNNNKFYYLDDFKNQFPDTFEYISYFNTINDVPGYNPRDYKGKNLEEMKDIYAELNVEGQIIKVDILLKKYKNPVSIRSIKKSLCLCEGCSDKNQEQGNEGTVDTATINKKFLNQNKVDNKPGANDTKTLMNSNIPLLEKAQNKLSEAQQFFALPDQKIAELQAKIDTVGISNIPGLQGITSPITDLLGSASGLTSVLQSPLNLPNVLPSIDAGSFPQIAGLLTNTNWKNLDVNSTLEIAKQLNAIACDFRLPIIGKVNWDDITDIDIEDFGEEFDKIIQGFQKKFEKMLTDIRDKIKNLVPDFIKNFKQFFKDIFTCESKPNVKNSDNQVN